MKLKHDYRISETELAHVKGDNQPWAVIEGVWTAYVDCPNRQRATFLKRLTPGQRAFLALNGLEAEVNNGGIHQYLWNSTGDLWAEAQAGLASIGADAHHRLFLKVLRLFPDRAVLGSLRRRRNALDKIKTSVTDRLFDTPFFKLEDRKRTALQTLRQAYLKTHRNEFVLPAGQAEEKVSPPKPGARDYRAPRKKTAHLRGEKLHWKLIESLWDDYWESLKAGKQEALAFLTGLTPGQRALIAIDILDKTVLRLGGCGHFLGSTAGADVLAAEAEAGLRLIGARPYAAVIERARQAAGNLPELQRAVEERSRRWEAAKKTGDDAAIQQARQAWRAAFDLKRHKEGEVAEVLASLSTEFKALLDSSDRKIESYIEAYVGTHPDEFYR